MRIDHDQTESEIAGALATHGFYVGAVDARSLQDFVDLRWAAHKAAKVLDLPIVTTIDRHHPNSDGQLSVTVTVVQQDP